MTEVLAFQVSAADPAVELASLVEWLRTEPQLKNIEYNRDSFTEGQMGGLADTIRLILEPSGIATAAISALVTWLSTRRRPVKVAIRRGAHSFEIEAGGAKDALLLTKEIAGHLHLNEVDEFRSE